LPKPRLLLRIEIHDHTLEEHTAKPSQQFHAGAAADYKNGRIPPLYICETTNTVGLPALPIILGIMVLILSRSTYAHLHSFWDTKPTKRFWKVYCQLPPAIRTFADKQFSLLKANPEHRSLQFKKVIGPHFRTLVGPSLPELSRFGGQAAGKIRLVLDRAP
jgi:hypothetical protein